MQPNSKKTRKQYDNVTIRPAQACTNIEECFKLRSDLFHVSGSPENPPLVVNIVSSHQIDNRPITKRVEFFAEHFEMYADGTRVRFEHLSLDNNVGMSFHHSILIMIDSLPYCKGIESETGIKGMIARRNGGGQLRYHTRTCCLLVAYLSKTGICNSCRHALENSRRTKKVEIKESTAPDVQVQDKDLTLNIKTDWEAIIDEMFKEGSEELRVFIKAQKLALGHVSKWDSRIISVCLNLYIRSPRSYKDLVDSKLFSLPSGRTLRSYKNVIHQKQGILKGDD